MPTTATITPETFLAHCAANGVRIEDAKHGFLTLCKRFTPGDKDAYTAAETDVGIIYSTPSAGAGSVWGTDGGSVGGHVGLMGGYMRLNKSNVAKRFIAKLAKLMEAGQ